MKGITFNMIKQALRFGLMCAGLLAVTHQAISATHQSYTLFESGQVRPLALAPSGNRLYAVNTPDNTLEVFRITDQGLQHEKSIPVGLEPVAVALRNESEAWVVNHLSDSVSIVSLELGKERVTRTLLVGDEPSDIVFADKSRNRAFVTTAHRGQNVPYDPKLTTPGIGRADVWVFDADKLDDSLQGTPLNIISLFTDTPRALAVSPDGKSVYAAGFKTGTQTTTVWLDKVEQEGGAPEPKTNHAGDKQPSSGLIVKWNGKHWADETGRFFDKYVKFSLPDKDVFQIDATANPPALVNGAYFSNVGSVLFNMIVNPVNNKVYVTNLDSKNQNRFEGHGKFAGHTVKGQFIENRISILDAGGVSHRHLNKHIDYKKCCAPVPNKENQLSLSSPLEMAITGNGKTLYVTAYGSSKVGVYDTQELENDKFTPSEKNLINVAGGGPSGLALDESRNRLYVLTRFNNSVSIIDTRSNSEISHTAMHNPEPPSILEGRRFLYDAALTSSHGDSSCASCHIFGDMDQLAWDLGNPDNDTAPMYGFFRNTAEQLGVVGKIKHQFAALKGPMTTQSMRGMANHGPMHWRGDRNGADPDPKKNFQPDGGQFNEEVAFKAFNVAYVGLLGRDQMLSDAEMDAFTKFVLQITYPPNPIRNLDNSLTPDQQAGFNFFSGGANNGIRFGCSECHVLDRNANAEYGVAKPGFFGTNGFYTLTNISTQALKIPHLRNLYQKIGMFGTPNARHLLPAVEGKENAYMGDQIRGFGFIHDGTIDTVFLRQSGPERVFRAPGARGPHDAGQPHGYARDRATGDAQRRQTEQFLLAFDTNLFPIVGQQITLTATNAQVVGKRIDLFIQRAEADHCDLVAHQGQYKGYLYMRGGKFKANTAAASPLSDAELRAMAKQANGEITYTCVPPGSGTRIALDRDEDGVLDGDEIAAGSDPADKFSRPASLSRQALATNEKEK